MRGADADQMLISQLGGGGAKEVRWVEAQEREGREGGRQESERTYCCCCCSPKSPPPHTTCFSQHHGHRFHFTSQQVWSSSSERRRLVLIPLKSPMCRTRSLQQQQEVERMANYLRQRRHPVFPTEEELPEARYRADQRTIDFYFLGCCIIFALLALAVSLLASQRYFNNQLYETYIEVLDKYKEYLAECKEVEVELLAARKQLADLRAQLRKKCM